MSWSRNSKAAGTGAVVGVAALLATMSPAAAAGAGVTTGGWSTIDASGPISTPLCIYAGSGDEIRLANVGALQAGTALYAGTFNANFKLGAFYFGPQGTYLSNSSGCVGAPQGVPVSGTITTTGGTGSITCTTLNGTYTRATDVYSIQVSGSCGGVATNFVFSGNQAPCLGVLIGVDNCPESYSSTEFVGDYTQAP